MNFEKASRLGLRYNVATGNVDTEDLWQLPLEMLNTLAVKLNKEIKDAGEENYLKTQTKDVSIPQLKFDIVLHIITTRVAEMEARKDALTNKANDEKILAIIAAKEDAKLQALPVEDLVAALSTNKK